MENELEWLKENYVDSEGSEHNYIGKAKLIESITKLLVANKKYLGGYGKIENLGIEKLEGILESIEITKPTNSSKSEQ